LNCLLVGGLSALDAESRRFQHYEICLCEDGERLDELGRGAMGVTYRARDLNLDSFVALKIIGAGYAENAAARERFKREARTAAQLRHPNVASVFHFGETTSGQCFYAMELVEGETLEALVQREGPLQVDVALDVVAQVARALLAAEAHGLIHRDLKPSNLMVVADHFGATEQMLVKVIDFGLAKAAVSSGDSGATNITFSGTPGFASPEQLKGGQVEIDARSDIYSLGATLRYLLSGHAPSEASALASDLPGPVINLLDRVLATDPGERPQSARALLADLDRCRKEAAQQRRKEARKRATLVVALIAVCVAALTSYMWRLQHTVAGAAPEKSIAVLPFENLSNDEANAFFAAGVQDDVLTSLAQIHELRVISRTSVLAYQKPAGRNMREIGRALGVGTVLEGSVRRAGDRIVVNVQLVDTRTDRHLWAHRYDKKLADSLGLQGELANEIAGALLAHLSSGEKSRLDAKPTDNPEAYALYLNARGRQAAVNHSIEDDLAAEKLYQEAIALDPKFALAHAQLSITSSYLAFGAAQIGGRKVNARAAAEEAMRNAPSLGESHMARGLSLYWGDKAYAAAMNEFSIATKLLPNESRIRHYMAGIYRRQGRWQESVATYQRAQELDPLNREMLSLAAANYLMVRDWPAAAACYNRALEIAPDSAVAKIGLAYLEVFRRGDPGAGRKILQSIAPGIDPNGVVSAACWDLAMIERDYPAAEKILNDFPLEDFPRAGDTPKTFHQGRIALARRDFESAQRYFAAAAPAVEEWVREQPNDAARHAQLGFLYACMQRKEDAIRESRQAVELEPENQDAYHGACCAAKLALTFTLVGEADEAITLIERLLSMPGPIAWPDFPLNITLPDLRLRWEWDSLRANPRFQKILAAPEPRTDLK